jgi:dTDP-4-dehydrorhamnose reductase
MRIAVTGIQGQVVSALRERASIYGIDFYAVGRPSLDFSRTGTALPALKAVQPDAIVHAAAYNAVDQAEQESRLASQINIMGSGEVAAAARELSVPIVYLSTDYVFNGEKGTPYVETDPISPLNFYGSTKAAGEQAVSGRAPNHAILRISWIYSPFGKNFVRTILRAARSRDTLDIVSDQYGAPTSAFDVADGIVAVLNNLVSRPGDSTLRGLFHMTAAGDTSWAGFGEVIFAASKEIGGPFAKVRPIASKDYPQAAKRPANSRLDCSKIAEVHGVRLPDWQSSLKLSVERIVKMDESVGGTG